MVFVGQAMVLLRRSSLLCATGAAKRQYWGASRADVLGASAVLACRDPFCPFPGQRRERPRALAPCADRRTRRVADKQKHMAVMVVQSDAFTFNSAVLPSMASRAIVARAPLARCA